MPRTTISLSDADKPWPDRQLRAERVPRTDRCSNQAIDVVAAASVSSSSASMRVRAQTSRGRGDASGADNREVIQGRRWARPYVSPRYAFFPRPTFPPAGAPVVNRFMNHPTCTMKLPPPRNRDHLLTREHPQ